MQLAIEYDEVQKDETTCKFATFLQKWTVQGVFLPQQRMDRDNMSHGL